MRDRGATTVVVRSPPNAGNELSHENRRFAATKPPIQPLLILPTSFTPLRTISAESTGGRWSRAFIDRARLVADA